MKVQKTSQIRSKSFEKVKKNDIKRVVLRSKLHNRYLVFIDFNKRDQ